MVACELQVTARDGLEAAASPPNCPPIRYRSRRKRVSTTCMRTPTRAGTWTRSLAGGGSLAEQRTPHDRHAGWPVPGDTPGSERLCLFPRTRRRPIGRALFLALEGVFQARLAGQQSVFRRLAWLCDALGKLDHAVTRGARPDDLLPRFGARRTARSATQRRRCGRRSRVGARPPDGLPTAIRRSVYRALAKAYAVQGRTEAAREALQRSGHASRILTSPNRDRRLAHGSGRATASCRPTGRAVAGHRCRPGLRLRRLRLYCHRRWPGGR